MRVIFMGTPDFATALLKNIISRGHEIVAVYTQPPRPAGRGLSEKKSSVHCYARSLGFLTHTPKNFRSDEEIQTFISYRADVAIVAAYGLILPPPILAAPKYGCLNLHGSLLPRWRGAAPIQRAIMAGDAQTGVMVMKMDAGLDTGPVAAAKAIAISPDMTAGELHDRLAELGAILMVDALDLLERGALIFAPQNEVGACYAEKINKAEARIDWSKSAEEIRNHIRGLSPFPGAFFEADFGHGVHRVKVLQADVESASGPPGCVMDDFGLIACGEKALRLERVQRAGKSEMSMQEFLRGQPIKAGVNLS
ncbi:MAG: methionyl-tRNA formyltransferase [Methylocystis sp.]